MKKPHIIVLVFIPFLLLLLPACESGGKFRVINRTSYPVYTELPGETPVTIQAGQEYTYSIDTDSQSFLTGKIRKKVIARIIGETYHILDDVQDRYVDETEIIIEPGKTLNAYIDPNRASIKIVNNSNVTITNALVYKHNFISGLQIGTLENIAPGESKHLRVEYVPRNSDGEYINPFYYTVSLITEEEDVIQYGGETNILGLDSQFLIELR
ncbi:MAG: hypothetical protein PHI68_04820 [Candidatus Cloacimonetes bacterium]|nr:hypothetical protein [Candidatus Cloacimonadota bacterium]